MGCKGAGRAGVGNAGGFGCTATGATVTVVVGGTAVGVLDCHARRGLVSQSPTEPARTTPSMHSSRRQDHPKEGATDCGEQKNAQHRVSEEHVSSFLVW